MLDGKHLRCAECNRPMTGPVVASIDGEFVQAYMCHICDEGIAIDPAKLSFDYGSIRAFAAKTVEPTYAAGLSMKDLGMTFVPRPDDRRMEFLE